MPEAAPWKFRKILRPLFDENKENILFKNPKVRYRWVINPLFIFLSFHSMMKDPYLKIQQIHWEHTHQYLQWLIHSEGPI